MLSAQEARQKLQEVIALRDRRMVDWANNQLPEIQTAILRSVEMASTTTTYFALPQPTAPSDSVFSYLDTLQKILQNLKYVVSYKSNKDGYLFTIDFAERLVR